MNDMEKITLAFGAGFVVGKWGGSLAWWLLGGATALFIMNSPKTRTAIGSGTRKVYNAYRNR